MKRPNRADLIALKDLIEAGKVRPVIDSTYPLARTRQAIARITTGRARGTIVVSILESPESTVSGSGATATDAPMAAPAPATTGA